MAELRLSYQQLADRLGIRPDAARHRAKRRGWRIVTGNDGRAIVHVDETDLAVEPPPRPGDDQADDREIITDQLAEAQARVQALEEERNRLTASLADQRERAARAEGEAGALRERCEDLARRLDRAEELASRPWWRRLIG